MFKNGHGPQRSLLYHLQGILGMHVSCFIAVHEKMESLQFSLGKEARKPIQKKGKCPRLMNLGAVILLCASSSVAQHVDDPTTVDSLIDTAELTIAGHPLLGWSQSDKFEVHKLDENIWRVNFDDSENITCSVRRLGPGKYGECRFRIELTNTGDREVRGSLSPPFFKWRRTQERIEAASPEHFFLGPDFIISGRYGLQRIIAPRGVLEEDAFSTVPLGDTGRYVCANLLQMEGSLTPLTPGQSCLYVLHLDTGEGGRNDALAEIFRRRGAYRVDPSTYSFEHYDNPALAWAKDVTAVWINFAWDKEVIDPVTGEYRLTQSLIEAQKLFGGFDLYFLWPFWPRAGFDDRFQYDHYRNMPGGLEGLGQAVRDAQALGVRFGIAYCQWSETNRDGSPEAVKRSHEELVEVACELGVDAVLMDCMPRTPKDILEMARKRGRNLVPFNEGDPNWEQTQTNLLGRIHNTRPMHPFNLKKYMLPHHPQLRVCEPGGYLGAERPEGWKRMRHDFVLSFFQGIGIEILTSIPNNHPDCRQDWPILARLLDLRRTNRENFMSPDWEPLVDSEDREVWVICSPALHKTIYTLCSTNPGGHHGPLLRLKHDPSVHYVDLWRYRSLEPKTVGSDDVLDYYIPGFEPGQGIRTGKGDYSPGCVGVFPRRLSLSQDYQFVTLAIEDPEPGAQVEIWKDTIKPGVEPIRLEAKPRIELDLYKTFGGHFNDAVVFRLVDRESQLLDVAILGPDACRFFMVDRTGPTSRVDPARPPDDMVHIPGGRIKTQKFEWSTLQPAGWRLPKPQVFYEVDVQPFWMDRYPVTNAQFAEFVKASGYAPARKTNFLKHFVDGHSPADHQDHPVVYVSYKDAKAYAQWAGKRLPTLVEWQFAAGGADDREWPWGGEFDANRCNTKDRTTPVSAYPAGASPYQVQDLVGNVWQWTDGLLDDGRHLQNLVCGGSWYDAPRGPWWVPGGPQKIKAPQALPLFGPAMNRFSTVGFRCVRDAIN